MGFQPKTLELIEKVEALTAQGMTVADAARKVGKPVRSVQALIWRKAKLPPQSLVSKRKYAKRVKVIDLPTENLPRSQRVTMFVGNPVDLAELFRGIA